jgi:hypothetical protein
MLSMPRATVMRTVLCGGALVLTLASCQREQQDSLDPDLTRIFGNGYQDASPVICRVGDLEITQAEMERRYDELPQGLRSRYSGPDWERRFLRYMIDEALLVQEAFKRKLHRDPVVAQHLISQRRATLKMALTEMNLLAGKKPTEEQIRQHFELNKEKYLREGQMHARVIICPTRDVAYRAYNTVRMEPGDDAVFTRAVATFSVNLETVKQAGDLGWFTRQGFIPAMPYGQEFADTIWDWETGLHEPVLINGQWHVVEILDKTYERPLSLQEARDLVIKDLEPLLRDEEIAAFLREARKSTPIEYFGAYQLGQGHSDKELFDRARIASTPEQKIDLYNLILEDYPESDYTAATLFLLGNLYLDVWGDYPLAGRYFGRLCREYPESEYYADARYIMDNMRRPDFVKPQSVEDLKQKSGEQ